MYACIRNFVAENRSGNVLGEHLSCFVVRAYSLLVGTEQVSSDNIVVYLHLGVPVLNRNDCTNYRQTLA